MTKGEKPALKRLVGRYDLNVLGVDLRESFPLPENSEFEDLLRALEEIEAARDGDKSA